MTDKDFSVTPWEVSGVVDYARLIRDFGTQPLTEELGRKFSALAGEKHLAIERGVYYSHRDLDLVLKDYEAGKKFFLYTGRGPSGPMHIGHIIQFYLTSWLQKRFGVNTYVQLTDDEKFLEEKSPTLEETNRWAKENALDIAAAGFDPDRTFIFQDTEYIGNIYRLAVKVARKVNFSVVRAVFGFTGETNIGFAFYPAVQVVPSLFEDSRCLIPCAIDQDPFWRVQRDIAESLGYRKAAALHSKFLPPLTGVAGKMSASMPETAIYLSDTPEQVRQKIWKNAFSGGRATIEEHRRLGGDPDVDVPYLWLQMFFEGDDAKLKKLHDDYVSGKLLSGEMKEVLIEKVTRFLKGHQERRERARDSLDSFTRSGRLASAMWAKTYGLDTKEINRG
ncbi:MAG: tryptophan--tRNA ligase [Nitrososphaerota archaeon]|nr:tryptophan--tRNA ligase [Nitrososphaerota archaeon]